MFRGEDVSKLNCGEWANAGTYETAREYAHVSEAILGIEIFQREYDYEGDGENRRLFIPACAANATGADGSFDVREAQRRDDWPKFSEAIESEIQNLKMARGSLLMRVKRLIKALTSFSADSFCCGSVVDGTRHTGFSVATIRLSMNPTLTTKTKRMNRMTQPVAMIRPRTLTGLRRLHAQQTPRFRSTW